MKKTLLLGLLAGASLTMTVTSCSNPDYATNQDIDTKPLPPLPPAPDTTGGKTAAPTNQPREINSVNAIQDIKRMQPQM